MATLVRTEASKMQCGDRLVMNNKIYNVLYIDGPDHIGTFDVHIQDETGKDHFIIVQDLVTIIM